jgi:hypothetical protein
MSSNNERLFIGWRGMKFANFKIFFEIFRVIPIIKTASFSGQTIKFIFKQSNFNSNESNNTFTITHLPEQ